MTNNEAIKYLKQLYPNGGHCWLDEQRIEAIGMAVKALQEEPVSIWHDVNIELPRKDKEVLALVIRPNLRAYVAFPSGHGTLYSLFGTIDINDVSKWCYIDDILNLSNVERTGKNWKEPVSEELEEASKEWLRPQLDKSYANYGEAKMMELTHFDGYAMLDAIEFGAKWQKTNLWKPADGDDLPEYDREVVAFQEIFPTDVDVPSILKIVIAHRPYLEGYDGKSITTGQTKHYTPKTYGIGGWNIPDVKFWLDIELPKEIEL